MSVLLQLLPVVLTAAAPIQQTSVYRTALSPCFLFDVSCLCLQLAVCPLDEGCISFILARVLGALVYLHGMGRLHRCG